MQGLKTSFRTTLVIGITLGFILGGFASAWKVGTDSSGNKWGWLNNNLGYISTSNNDRLYPPTSDGFNSAVWSFNGSGLGGTIYLPAGVTHLTHTVNISHIGMTIQGMGWDASFLYLDWGSNCDGIKIFSATGADTAMWITLKDFTIDGEKAHNTIGTGINITLSDNGFIENVYATGWAKHGIWLNGISEVWTINNVHTYNNGVDGIHISGDCGDNKLFALSSYSNGNDGLNIAGTSNDLYSCKGFANGGDGIQIEGNLNRVTSCGSWDNDFEGIYVTDHDQTIGATSLVDCKAFGNDNSGFRVWGKNVILRGCISYDAAGSVYVQDYGLQVDTGSIDIMVDSCNMSGSVSNPIPQSVHMTIINSRMQSVSSYGYIVNSLGHSFIPSQSGLQQAIWDLNSSGGGWVELPKVNLPTTSTINITNNVSVNFNYAQIIPTGDFNVIKISGYNTLLENVIINQSLNTAFSNSSACILPYGYHGDGSGHGEGFDVERRRTVRNVAIIGIASGVNKQKGIGIYLNPTVNTDDFAFDLYENIKCKFLNCSIKILINTPGTYTNFNTFNEITGVGCAYFIWLRDTTTASGTTITMNSFMNIQYEAEGISNEHYPIFLQGDCDFNRFQGAIMDWSAQGDTTALIYVNDTGCDQNVFDFFTGIVMEADSRIIDSGDRSVFYSEFFIKQYDVNTTYINYYDSDTTGVKFYASTTGQPLTYFYGYDTGTSSKKFGYLKVRTDGGFQISSDDREDILIYPSQGDYNYNVTIGSTLKLRPRATPVLGATEGTMYYDSTYHKLRLRTNTAWVNVTVS